MSGSATGVVANTLITGLKHQCKRVTSCDSHAKTRTNLANPGNKGLTLVCARPQASPVNRRRLQCVRGIHECDGTPQNNRHFRPAVMCQFKFSNSYKLAGSLAESVALCSQLSFCVGVAAAFKVSGVAYQGVALGANTTCRVFKTAKTFGQASEGFVVSKCFRCWCRAAEAYEVEY